MAVFESEEQLYTVLQGVFERLTSDQNVMNKLYKNNVVMRMNFVEPEAQVALVFKNGQTEVMYGPSSAKANMEFTLSADLLHKIWLGEESTSQAFFNGRIKTKGNFMKAMKMVDLFRECERVYPSVAAENHLL